MMTAFPRRWIVIAVVIALQLLPVGTTHAASIAGQIQTETNVGIGNSSVELYVVESKGPRLQATQTTDASGNYSFSGLGVGTYRILAKPNAATNRLWRWYDVAAPASGGRRVSEADDLVLAGAGSTLTGINTTSEVGGGVDGHITGQGGVDLPDVVVRIQDRGDPLSFFDVKTQTNPDPGLYSFPGMLAGNYLFIAHDLNGSYRTAVFGGPYTVTAGSSLSLGDLAMQVYPTDPYEPNWSPEVAALSDVTSLHAVPPSPFATTDAVIAPLGSDSDWYCFNAMAGDHLLISTSSTINVLGQVYEHPFFDPIMSWWTDGGTVMAASADDTGTSRHPQIEAWVSTAGKHCAAVSAAGTTSWDGTGGASVGAYQLRIDQLNRYPLVTVDDESIAEGETLVAAFAYHDLELDPLTAQATLTNVHGVEVAADFDIGADGGVMTWTPSQTAAADGPYLLTVTVNDGTYDAFAEANIEVIAVNLPPPIPTLVTPFDGATLDTLVPSLVLSGAADPDGDDYDFEVELRYGASDAVVAQSATFAAVVGAELAFPVAQITEDTTVYWRARSDDGSALSNWSATRSFVVDTMAENPPPDPDPLDPCDDDSPDAPSVPENDGCNDAGDVRGLLVGAYLLMRRVEAQRLRARAA